jgi:hypothetical protein
MKKRRRRNATKVKNLYLECSYNPRSLIYGIVVRHCLMEMRRIERHVGEVNRPKWETLKHKAAGQIGDRAKDLGSLK